MVTSLHRQAEDTSTRTPHRMALSQSTAVIIGAGIFSLPYAYSRKHMTEPADVPAYGEVA